MPIERADEQRVTEPRKVTLRGKPLNVGDASAKDIARRLKKAKKPKTTADREAELKAAERKLGLR